jgi:hypothetical protein
MLVALAADHYVFAMATHHIVSDGLSMSILIRELMQLYAAYVEGREPDLPVTAQYVDYAGWEQQLAAEGRFARSLDFWKRKLEGAPALIELPTDCSRPTAQSFRGQRMLRRISGELLGRIKDLARREGSTLFVVLLSAWQVLKKKGPLDVAEREEMNRHTVYGFQILSASPRLSMGAEIALYHHEKWDGTGYPKGVGGETIPLSARIVQMADIYDALRSERPYKPSFSHEKAVEILTVGDDRIDPRSHFDPRLIDLFADNHRAFEQIWIKLKD